MRLLAQVVRTTAMLVAGTWLGLGLVELTLRINTPLLPRIVPAPRPFNPPLTAFSYTVRYSDGDIFLWEAQQVRPIRVEANAVEAEVRFSTDEFGFRNVSPLPAEVDVAVVGRSYSLGAAVNVPWTQQLAVQTGWRVLNLAQPNSSAETKQHYLRHFAYPRRPRWVVVEVHVNSDALVDQPNPTWLLDRTLLNGIGNALKWAAQWSPLVGNAQSIYPLTIRIGSRTSETIFWTPDLAAQFMSADAVKSRPNWQYFLAKMHTMGAEANGNGACLALLYVPIRPHVYLAAATHAGDLEPAFDLVRQEMPALRGVPADEMLSIAQRNGRDLRQAMRDVAGGLGAAFIDPTDKMVAAVAAGQLPFMAYDSHWTEAGHTLVAEAAADVLTTQRCEE